MSFISAHGLRSPKDICSTEPVHMKQGWLAEPSPDFRPCAVRCGWTEDQLIVSADLADEDVFNPVTKFNEHFYSFGDVFEIFIRSPDREEYVELHVNPNNTQFQLRIPSMKAFYAARGQAGLSEAWFIQEKSFESTVELTPSGWRVHAQIPFSLIKGQEPIQPGEEWLVSFCRYDYTRGQEKPVLSSTSPYSKADYHNQDEWLRMKFC